MTPAATGRDWSRPATTKSCPDGSGKSGASMSSSGHDTNTDLASLRGELYGPPPLPGEAPASSRGLSDWAVDILIPLMIFCMMLCVTWFLLDIRFVYTERLDLNLRAFAFFFVMGIVAVNRLRAERGWGGASVYMAGLVFAVGAFTVFTNSRGGMAGGYMASTFISLCFNISVVVILWKVTDRLTQDCCVDESSRAGEEGILRSRWWARRAEPTPVPEEKAEEDEKEPGHARPPRRHPAHALFYLALPIMAMLALGQRILPQGGSFLESAGSVYVGGYTLSLLMLLLLTSYRGIRVYCAGRKIPFPTSIAAFWLGLGTVMVVIVLVLGLWGPVPATPPPAGHVARLYESSGRTLSDRWDYHEHRREGDHSGASERTEDSESPGGTDSDGQHHGADGARSQAGEGDSANVEGQGGQGERSGDSEGSEGNDGGSDGGESRGGQGARDTGQSPSGDQQGDGTGREETRGNEPSRRDARNSGSAGRTQPPAEIPMQSLMNASPALKWLGYGVLVLMGLFILYGIFHLAAHYFGRAAKGPSRLAGLFDRLSRLFRRLTQVPKRKPRRAKVRVDSDIATCAQYQNPINGPMPLREKVQYSYDALCALAYDLGVPREEDQTPFEFLSALPEPIISLRDEAHTLTYHYVAGSYSTLPLPESVLDDLRDFWSRYEQLRARMVRRV